MGFLENGVSIVICTYNGKPRLAATLQHLADQKLSVSCEIIFVDNASTDGSRAFADAWWHTHGNKKIAFTSFKQPIPGKSYAQDLGYEKAKYEYLLVCDDDNWLCDTYVQTAFEIMDANSNIGALGGWCEAVFENEKPKWFDSYATYFAVSKQGDVSGDVTHKKGCLYGAGMVLRKPHWLELKSLGFEHLLTCRKGDSLSSGGDTEYSYALRLLGYKIWYDERLYFKHFMTDGRLHLSYVSRLKKAMSYSNFILLAYTDLLQGRTRTRMYFIKEVLRGFPIMYLKRLYFLIIGDYDQREHAKAFFRAKYHLLCSYLIYYKNIRFLKSWLRESDYKIT